MPQLLMPGLMLNMKHRNCFKSDKVAEISYASEYLLTTLYSNHIDDKQRFRAKTVWSRNFGTVPSC